MAGEPLLEPAKPTFPQSNLSMNPSGMKISIVLAPGVELSTTLDENTMNQVCAMWVQTRQQIANEMKFIDQVRNSKN